MVGFTRVRSGYHPESLSSLGVLTGSHPGTLGSLGFALGVVGFILSGWVDSSGVVALGSSWDVAFALGIGGFILGRWVHLGASLSSSGVVVFTRVRPGSLGASAGCTQRVVLGSPWGSLGSFGFTQGDVWGRCVHSGASWGSLTGCLDSLGFVLEVIGFFRGL